MGKNLDVILLEDIKSLGSAGDIVSVAEGYARNSLFPKGQAAIADDQAKIRRGEGVKRDRKKEEAKFKQLREVAQSLEGTELVLKAQVKDGEEIFGKVTAAMVARELKDQVKLEVKAKAVQLESPITRLGGHDVTILLGSEVEAKIRVTVVATGESVQTSKKDE